MAEQATPHELPDVVRLSALGDADLVSFDTLAELFGVTEDAVRKQLKRGELPQPAQIAGKMRWTVGALRRHFERLQARASGATDQTRDNLDL